MFDADKRELTAIAREIDASPVASENAALCDARRFFPQASGIGSLGPGESGEEVSSMRVARQPNCAATRSAKG